MGATAMLGIADAMEAYAQSREDFARFIGVKSEQMVFTQTCAIAISHLALGMRFEKGDEVLSIDAEYPSNAYPWIEAARRGGGSYRRLKTPKTREELTQLFEKEISSATKVVALSWVQYTNGLTADLKTLSKICHSKGARLIVDGIQGIGVIPFDFVDSGVDAVCGGTHKWMAGPFGLGFFAATEALLDELEPLYVGAMTYTDIQELKVEPQREPHKGPVKFEPGTPFLMQTLPAAESIHLFEKLGQDAIYSEAMRLSQFLRNELLERGAELQHEVGSQSPICNFVLPALHGVTSEERTQETFDKLWGAKILVSHRGGGIRVAPHAFNTDEDIGRLLDVCFS